VPYLKLDVFLSTPSLKQSCPEEKPACHDGDDVGRTYLLST